MAFAFKQRNGIEGQARKIALGQISKALEECGQVELEFDTVVHGLRRHCKKLRGLVRLIAPHFAESKNEDRAFRDAARGLAGTRDAVVLVETCNSVLAFDSKHKSKARIDPAEGAGMVTWLRSRIAAKPDAAERSGMLGNFVVIFEAASERAGHWPLSGRGFEQIGDGLEDTYRRMRHGLAVAEDKLTAEAMHEWRKHVKYHWHHVGLLRATAPDVMEHRRTTLDALGEMLGDHHNLAVLDDSLDDYDGADAKKAVATVRGVIGDLQHRLTRDAFTLGRQLAAEKPGRLRERFEQYWSLLPQKD